MHDHSNPVPWGSWLRTRGDDLRRPDRMIVQLGSRWHCLLCESTVTGSRAEHHLTHMLELDAWLAEHNPHPGPKPDSIRRSEDRRWRRWEELERAAALGEDPFRVAIVKVDPTGRRVRRRRLRHPRVETQARVRRLLEQGVGSKAIAKTLDISDNYAARLIREIDGRTPPK